MVKTIAVYDSFVAWVPVRQRYWKRRVDGIKQRYWKTTTRRKRVIGKGRYEFYGTGRDLYRAIVKSHRIVPKGYVDVSAERFLRDPERYGYDGYWIDRNVESG
jgi:hypothetical protein